MASLVVGTALSQAGAPGLIAFIGGAVGGYIDSEISKRIFEGEQKEPRLGGTPITMANHGDPILRVYGGISPDVDDTGPRVPAMVVWSSDPYAQPQGGSSKRGNATATTWFADVALMFAGNWLGGIDRLLVDGEVIFDDFPLASLQFPVNFSGTTTTVAGGTSDIILDYITRQSFTTIAGGGPGNQILSWVLLIKSRRNPDGSPQNPTAAAELGRLRSGDRITLFLGGQSGSWAQRQSHTIGAPNTQVAYLVTGVDRFDDGNVEVAVRLATIVNFADRYITNTGSNVDALYPGPIPTSSYPVFPANLLQLNTLTIGVLRQKWKQGILQNANPVDGVDWSIARGEDDGLQSPIVKDSQYGGLGDDAPFNMNRAVFYIKGLNLSAFGNRLPNIDAIVRESQNLYPAHLVLELCHIAKLSQQTVRLRLIDFIDTTQAVASMRFPTSGQWLADPGVHIAEMDDFAGNAGSLVNEGDPFFVHPQGQTIDFDTAIVYRFARFSLFSTGTPDTYVAHFTPRLPVDLKNYAITTYRWKTLPTGRCGGFITAGATETAASIEKICLAYNLELREHDTYIEVFNADARDVVTVNPRDLQTRQFGQAPDDPILLNDPAESKKPSRVSVKFANQNNLADVGLRDDTIDGLVIDEFRDTDDKGDVGPTKSFSPNVIDLQDITMTSAQAHAIARRLLRDARQRRFEGSRISLPSSYMHIQEGDLVEFGTIALSDLFETTVAELYGRELKMLVDRVEIGGSGFRVEIEGFIIEEPTTIPAPSTPVDIYGGVNVQRCNAQNVLANFQQIHPVEVDAPLSDNKLTEPGIFIVAVAGAGSNCPEHTVATVLRARDGSSNFEEVTRVVTNGTAGNTRYPEGSLDLLGRVSPGLYDTVSQVRVHLDSGSLSSVSKQAAANGDNFALIGKELVTFTSVAATTVPNEYLLKGFYRGWFGTTKNGIDHLNQEPFVYLGNAREALANVAFVPLTMADYERRTVIKTARVGEDPSQSPAITVYPKMNNIRPLPVANLNWRYDTKDLRVRWDRKPRPRFSQLSGVAPPKLESDEIYELEFRNASTNALFSSHDTADGATTFTYTAAQQTTDGSNTETTILVRVRRKVTTSAPSEWREITANVGAGSAGDGELSY